jgi:tRNA-guanine family transglycosylase
MYYPTSVGSLSTRTGKAPLCFIYAFTPRDYVLIGGKRTYLWELAQPFDGLILSRAYVDNKLERDVAAAGGVKKYFRIPEGVKVMSDSGAFTWRHLHRPPITPQELLEYYRKLGFDAGMHPDHISRPIKMVIKESGVKRVREITLEEARERFIISLEMAEETAKLLDSNSTYKGVEIYGVVQGWSPETYAECTRELLKMGYRRIAIGGLAIASTSEAAREIKAVMEVVKTINNQVIVHVLGVSRPSLIPLMAEQGVSSFDSATWLRAAWIRGAWFYHNRNTKQLLSFSVKLFDPRLGYHKDPPLPPCNCPVCKAVGVDEEGIVWTRRYYGNQRNMSRGFHNLYAFYEWFTEARVRVFDLDDPKLEGRVLVTTHCAAKKRNTPGPPQRLYLSARIRKVYEIAKQHGATFSVISAKYGLVYEDEVIEPYEATIGSGTVFDTLVDQVSEKLLKRGPWDWLVYFGTAKNYVTAFFCAAYKAGYGDRTIVVGKNTLGELDRLAHLLARSKQATLDQFLPLNSTKPLARVATP